MRLVRIIHLQVLPQAAFEVFDRTKIPSFEKPAGQDGKPEFYLVKPRTVDGRKMKDMLLGWVTQESPPLYATLQQLGLRRSLAPLRHQL